MDNTNEIEMFSPEEMQSPFDAIKETDGEGREWWNSRKLARLMGYQKYWNFERLMDKVATFLQQEKGLDLKEHMVEIEEMAKLGSGTTRQVKSFKLSRTACIAIALNADQRKPIVKAAKEYFTSKMNSQELATSVEGNVLIYRSSTGKVNVNVLFSQDTFWLSQKRMSELFNVSIPDITYHLKQIDESGELQLSEAIKKFLIPSEKWDEQGVLLYTQSPHQVLKCGDLVFEHLFKQLEVVVVDDGEVLGIANQMEAPIDLKTGFNRHEKRLQRVKSKLFSLKPFNLS